MHKIDKLARYFPKVENSEYFSRKKLCQNKIGTFHLKHPVQSAIPVLTNNMLPLITNSKNDAYQCLP